jgi:hypothetical protein
MRRRLLPLLPPPHLLTRQQPATRNSQARRLHA